jgi:hypothetical protein
MEEKFLKRLRRKLKERGFGVKIGYTFLLKGKEWKETKIYPIYPFTDEKKETDEKDEKKEKVFVFFEEYFTREVEKKLYKDLKGAFPKR